MGSVAAFPAGAVLNVNNQASAGKTQGREGGRGFTASRRPDQLRMCTFGIQA